MPDLNLNTVELVTTIRTAPQNGSPSSSDYNECQREVLVDLAAIVGFINNKILPLINALPDTSLLPLDAPVGIEGRTIWSDTSDQSPVFFDTLSNVPLTLADSLRVIDGILGANSQQLTDLGIEVASLQARLSSTNQNDIALALQNLSSSLNSLTIGHIDSSSSITDLQIRVTALETGISTLEDTDTSLNSRITTLESLNINTRLTALETDESYDVILFSPAVGLTNGQLLLHMNVVRTFILPIGLVGSIATAVVAPTVAVTLNIKRNGSVIGTVVYGIGATSGTFHFTTLTTFVSGDTLEFVSATTDTTIASVAVTLLAKRG